MQVQVVKSNHLGLDEIGQRIREYLGGGDEDFGTIDSVMKKGINIQHFSMRVHKSSFGNDSRRVSRKGKVIAGASWEEPENERRKEFDVASPRPSDRQFRNASKTTAIRNPQQQRERESRGE